MHAGHHVDLGGERADVTQATAVDAVVLREDATAHDLALQLLERVADLLVFLISSMSVNSTDSVSLTRCLISAMRS